MSGVIEFKINFEYHYLVETLAATSIVFGGLTGKVIALPVL